MHNATYNDGNPASINNISKFQELISQLYSKVNNATSSAALQLAVWEIVNETAGASSSSLDSRQFKADGDSLSMRWRSLTNGWRWMIPPPGGGYNCLRHV